MFRRFIATWLMLSILGYGMAVVANGHHDGEAQSGSRMHLLSDVNPDTGHPDQQADTDHCYHSIAHLLGLTQETTLSQIANPGLPDVVHIAHLHSLFLPPAFRPPIAA